jgi:hypothetical protein
MKLTYRMLASVATVVTVASMVTVNSADAGAARPLACVDNAGYKFSNVAVSYIAAFRIYGGPHTTLTVSEARGTTVTGTITGALKTSASILIASAETTITTSIALAKTTTATVGGSWTTPTNASGWLAYGAQTRTMGWSYGHYVPKPACTYQALGGGSANLPTLAPYIFHS